MCSRAKDYALGIRTKMGEDFGLGIRTKMPPCRPICGQTDMLRVVIFRSARCNHTQTAFTWEDCCCCCCCCCCCIGWRRRRGRGQGGREEGRDQGRTGSGAARERSCGYQLGRRLECAGSGFEGDNASEQVFQ